MNTLCQIFNKFIKYSLLLPAECLYTFPRKYARYAETLPVQPLKGLRETRATSVSYRASVPAGHAGCEVALSYQASSPDGDGVLSVYMGSRFVPTANYSLLTRLTPSPPRNATSKPVYLTLGHGITAST